MRLRCTDGMRFVRIPLNLPLLNIGLRALICQRYSGLESLGVPESEISDFQGVLPDVGVAVISPMKSYRKL